VARSVNARGSAGANWTRTPTASLRDVRERWRSLSSSRVRWPEVPAHPVRNPRREVVRAPGSRGPLTCCGTYLLNLSEFAAGRHRRMQDEFCEHSTHSPTPAEPAIRPP
jgi:hypothetical protein